MSNRSTGILKSLMIEAMVIGWLFLLALLVVAQNSGMISQQGVRVFTGVLIGAGLLGPLVLIGGFLYKRSKAERDTPIEGCCPRCRYNLTGQPDWPTAKPGSRVQCPECGTMVRMVDSRSGGGGEGGEGGEGGGGGGGGGGGAESLPNSSHPNP